MHECCKMKRLKSHRERNQSRGYGKKTSKCSSQHHHCPHRSRKDMAHFHSCCPGGCHCSLRRDASTSSVIPVSQEPNIITESRLIGHHGLFNHEVKSIDIKRFLGEKWKMEKCKAQEKIKATSHPCSASQGPFPFSGIDCMAGETEKLVLCEDKSDKASKAHDEVGGSEKDHIQGLAHTLEQRPQQILPELSSESCKSTFLTDRSTQAKGETVKSSKAKHVTSVKDRESQLMSSVNNNASNEPAKETISSLEQTPKNQRWPGLHTQIRSLSPVKPSSSNSLNNHHRRREPHRSASQSACAVVAGLCRSLKFPFLKKRSLVEESRRVLLSALQERHGAQQLQGNIRLVGSCYSFDSSVTKGSLNQEETTEDQDEALFTTFIPESPPCFQNQENNSLKIRRSRHVSWKSRPQLPHSMKQVKPVETSGGFMDNVFIPTRSPKLSINSEPSGSMASEHLFTLSPASSWGEKQPASPLWGGRFDGPRSKQSVRFDLFNQTRVAAESSSSRSLRSELPFFLHQPQSQFQHTARPVSCPQDQFPLKTETCFFAPSPVQIQHQQQQSHFQSFHQTKPPLSCLPRFSDMGAYPPSYVLDKEAPVYFPSLEPWSFPPMRLY